MSGENRHRAGRHFVQLVHEDGALFAILADPGAKTGPGGGAGQDDGDGVLEGPGRLSRFSLGAFGAFDGSLRGGGEK